ncbi:MAG: O-antigen ligase family protein, partial [Candidatus Gottesmanbacteria bacterium]
FSKLKARTLYPLAAFLFFLLLSTVFSQSLLFSIPAFFQMLAYIIWFCLFLGNITYHNHSKIVAVFILLVSLVLSIISLYYLVPAVSKPPVSMNLVYASYGHNHLANILLFSIPITLAFFLVSTQRKHLLGWGFLLLFYLVTFILTFSRGAFLVLPIVALIQFKMMKPQMISHKLLTSLMIAIPIGLIVIIGIFSHSQTGLEAKKISPYDWLVKQVVKPEILTNRLDYWREAVMGFTDKPILGYGLGTFELVALKYQNNFTGWSNYAHNFYLQTLAESGIFALASFIIFLISVLKLIWRKETNRKDFLSVGLWGAVLASTLHSLIDYDWHFPAVFLIFLLIMAEFINCYYIPVEVADEDRSSLLAPRAKINPQKLKYFFLFLTLIVFLFGQSQLLSEYFTQKGDFTKAILVSPWPAVRLRSLGSRLFSQDFTSGEKTFNRIGGIVGADGETDKWLADKYFQEKNLLMASIYFRKAINENPLGNFRLYPKLGSIYLSLGEDQKRDELYDDFAQKLAKIKIRNYNDGLSKTSYKIGLELFKEGKDQETIFWWQRAHQFSPQWSYYYVELASLYLKLGDFTSAQKTLTKCLKFSSPKIHCQEYLNRLDKQSFLSDKQSFSSNKGQTFEEPGFYNEKINKEISDF